MQPLLEVTDLTVTFPTDAASVAAVRGLSYQRRVTRSGRNRRRIRIRQVGGGHGGDRPAARVRGSDRIGAPARRRATRHVRQGNVADLRGKAIGTVFQDPMSALTPVYTVGDQIAEAIRIHQRDVTRAQARTRAVELLELVGHRPARPPGQGVPARAVGWRAPARRHRDRDRQRPRPADLRRADHGARRDCAGADPRRAAGRPAMSRAPAS